MIRLPSLYFLWTVFFFAPIVTAEEDELDQKEQSSFVFFDENKDGKLSRDEFRELMAYGYRDAMSSINIEESNLEFIRRVRVEADLSKLDKDGDGEVSDDEASDALREHLVASGELEEIFKLYDLDGDNFVTWTEFYKPEDYAGNDYNDGHDGDEF
mmetsp:Transcript_5463/g.6828  ORF Transcript_5463/g.6828 Transcript_5463/m.6828 type:complete len:156 (+) Transcript_5463:179-646(+)